MSTATAEPTTAETPTPEPTHFQWAAYVHVGDGATDCADNGAACTESGHFHAWLRLPNQFVRDDVRKQALAARARRLRLFKDPESDSATILEGELDELRAEAERDGNATALIDRVMLKGWGERHLAAMREVNEEDDFEHIEADRERFTELSDLPAEERPTEEYAALDAHILAYGDRVEAQRKEAEEPLRESLKDKTVDELLAIIREDRIASEGNAAFFDAWVRGSLVAGTYQPVAGTARPTAPLFEGASDLNGLTPEEAEALRATFVGLESQFQAGLGNS